MTPGPSVPYTPLHYGVEAGFFKEQGIEVQVLAVRAGQIGVASLTSGEVDAITHAGTGVAAAIRGLPVKVISVSNERPNHEMLVLPTVRGPQDLKGKSLGIGSLEGTGGIIVRRILQAKGLNPDKDVTFISMATEVRLQALISSTVAGAMMSPPYTFLAVDRGYQVFGRGKDYVRYLTEGVRNVREQDKAKAVQPGSFPPRAGIESVNYYRANPGSWLRIFKKSLPSKTVDWRSECTRKTPTNRTENGEIDNAAIAEILETARETMKVKNVYFCQSTFRFFLAPGNKMRAAEAQHSQASFCRHSVACAITCPWAMK